MDEVPGIVLIGAGPVGLEMAVALRDAGLAYVHLEAGPIGATINWWAPGTRWFSSSDRIAIAGVPISTPAQEKVTREDYLAYLRGIVQQFGLEVQTFRQVSGIRPAAVGGGGRFELTIKHTLIDSAPEQRRACQRLILATGGTATPNMLGVPGEELGHVSHYFADPHRYFAKRVVIVGGANSSIEAALRCHRAGAQVAVSYRGGRVDGTHIKYWLWPEFSGLMKSGVIRSYMGTTVEEIRPDCIVLRETMTRNLQMVPADFVLALTGYQADMTLARMAGVNLLGERQIPAFNPETMETNVPGVYVIGTATAGTQRGYKIFLENCHVHVPRVLAHLLGKAAPNDRVDMAQVPET